MRTAVSWHPVRRCAYLLNTNAGWALMPDVTGEVALGRGQALPALCHLHAKEWRRSMIGSNHHGAQWQRHSERRLVVRGVLDAPGKLDGPPPTGNDSAATQQFQDGDFDAETPAVRNQDMPAIDPVSIDGGDNERHLAGIGDRWSPRLRRRSLSVGDAEASVRLERHCFLLRPFLTAWPATTR
jgi:hypothetical protein